MKYPLILLAAFGLIASVNATDTLTADEAVRTALSANFGIMIARDNAEIAKTANTPGNAGMLPSAALTASDNYLPSATIDQQPKGGTLQSSGGAVNNLNAAVALSWTIFDGGKMFIAKARLVELEKLGDLELRDRVSTAVFDVFSAYYDVIRQKQRLAALQKILDYNRERVSIIQTGFTQGLKPKTDLLQAQIDANVNKGNVLSQQNAITDAKRVLNVLMSRSPDTDFEVSDSIPLGYTPDREKLSARLLSENTGILVSRKRVAVADLGVKEASAQVLPKVAVNGGYLFSQTDNAASSTNMSRTAGPQVGGTVTIPLYQSGNAARQIKTAKLQRQSAEHALEAATLDAAARLDNALKDFDDLKALLGMELDNAELAKENLEIAVERLRAGQSTALELRLAEESYEQSQSRLVDIKYTLKQTEIRIRQLVGEL